MGGFARVMSEDERRISLRVDAALFRELDRKRYELGTTFQEVGVRLLRGWLEGENKPTSLFDECTPGERKRLERYLTLMRNARHPEKIAALIDVWVDDFKKENV
jgi:hypothetical protein